jgi:hypothetical protein
MLMMGPSPSIPRRVRASLPQACDAKFDPNSQDKAESWSAYQQSIAFFALNPVEFTCLRRAPLSTPSPRRRAAIPVLPPVTARFRFSGIGLMVTRSGRRPAQPSASRTTGARKSEQCDAHRRTSPAHEPPPLDLARRASRLALRTPRRSRSAMRSTSCTGAHPSATPARALTPRRG